MPDQHPGSHGTWSCRCCNIREKEHFASGGSIHRQWHAPGCRQGQGTRKPGGLRRTPSNLEVKTHLDKSLTSQSFLQEVLVTWLDSGQHHYNGYCVLNAREVSLNGAGPLPFFLPAGMRRPWLGQGCHLGFMSDDLTTSWTWRHNIFTHSRFFSIQDLWKRRHLYKQSEFRNRGQFQVNTTKEHALSFWGKTMLTNVLMASDGVILSSGFSQGCVCITLVWCRATVKTD